MGMTRNACTRGRLVIMEKCLRTTLITEGISCKTLEVLEEEVIQSLRVFLCLKKEHFDILSEKLKLGQHASVMTIIR